MSYRVLIFDSGVGGLSIYMSMAQKLPKLDVSYVLDNAAFPYGNLNSDVLIQRCCQIIPRLVLEQAFDLVIVACNTASTSVLDALRTQVSIPVVGVVPAVKPAAALSQTGCIGVLATPTTVQSAYLTELIHNFAQNKRVYTLGSVALVEQAERKMLDKPVDLTCVRRELKPWLDDQHCPDTIVLGCTHFPLIQAELAQILPDVRWVDSGEAIARRVSTLLSLPMQILDEKSPPLCLNHVFYTQESPALNMLKLSLKGVCAWRLFEITV